MLDSPRISFSALQACPRCGAVSCVCEALHQSTARHIRRSNESVQKAGQGASQKRQPGSELSPDQAADLDKLRERDREVRSHEQAHIATGGSVIASGARYTFQKGPDGQMYAIGGEVAIDASKVAGDPQATQEKARKVRQAAMAPANPSGQDMIVASKAAQMEVEARTELQENSLAGGAGLDDVQEPDENPGLRQRAMAGYARQFGMAVGAEPASGRLSRVV